MILRIIKDKFFFVLLIFLSSLSIIPLILILFYLLKEGIPVINWRFLSSLPSAPGEAGGGIANAIVGTLILVGAACFFSIPLGVLSGIFLSEFQESKLAGITRLSSRILQGIPSIVLGIIAYAWLVKPMHRFSALSGGLALGLIMLPVIVQATEETLKLVPNTLKEASLALGATYSRTLFQVILPAGRSGILTGILLSASRVAGETAPLLFTAFGTSYMSANLFKPVNALPLFIFNYATSPYPSWNAQAWGASLVLVVFVFILNFGAKIFIQKWKAI
jgi:phosphate transport system permease protein